MENNVFIIGGFQTDFERNWTKEGKNYIAMLKETIEGLLEDTGITFEEIKELNSKNKIAIFVGNFCAEYYVHQGHLGPILTQINDAFYGVPSARYEAACASGSVAIDAAMTKIQSGDYDLAIVIGWEMMKTVNSKQCAEYLGLASVYDKESKGIEYPFPKLFGKLADEISDKYHISKEKLGRYLAKISKINYENAKRNPNAQTRKWFMNEEQANARGNTTNEKVGGFLAISDCSQVTDGAVAVVLASDKYIEEKRNKNSYPRIKGWGHRVAPYLLEDKFKENEKSEYVLPWTRQAVLDAYKRANLTVDDISLFETHDCFTSSEYAAISCFGITKPGEEYKAIENDIISFEGSKPINPSGGLIGCGHPVGASGVRMLLDLYKQIANKARRLSNKRCKKCNDVKYWWNSHYKLLFYSRIVIWK